jgi:hypothetical protein
MPPPTPAPQLPDRPATDNLLRGDTSAGFDLESDGRTIDANFAESNNCFLIGAVQPPGRFQQRISYSVAALHANNTVCVEDLIAYQT